MPFRQTSRLDQPILNGPKKWRFLTLRRAIASACTIAATCAAFAVTPGTSPKVAADYGRLPLSFVVNQGQSAPQVRFAASGQGYQVILTSSEAVLGLSRPGRGGDKSAASIGDSFKLDLPGSKAGIAPTGEKQLPGKANFFLGNDPAKWHADIPTYSRVRYAEVYPGIDLVYYGNQRQLEFDFVVAAHARPEQIRLHLSGARRMRIDAAGNLEVVGRHGQMAFHKPVLYQERDGKRESVDGAFLLAGGNVSFRVGDYDPELPLIIDPVLAYATYLGGSCTQNISDIAYALAVDTSGNAYVAGMAGSIDFPVTSGALQTAIGTQTIGGLNLNAQSNAFITKLNASGTALLYSTYLGGGGGRSDWATAIALDASGNAYVTGQANSANFPVTTGAFQTSPRTQNSNSAFVAKLDPSGSALIYSTYLGGSLATTSDAIAVNANGNVYVAGYSDSSDHPVSSGAYQSTNHTTISLGSNVFVTEFSADGSSLVYSTYIGGSRSDNAKTLALDAQGNAYVAGAATSSDYPVTSGAYQTAKLSTRTGSLTGFISKLSANGDSLLYSTFLGGSSGDSVNAIALDNLNNVYATGVANSSDFPVSSAAYQSQFSSGSGFIAKLNPSATDLVYSTFLHGTHGGFATPAGIALDGSTNVYVAGSFYGDDLPVTSGAVQSVNNAYNGGGDAGFLAEIDSSGSSLLYATYFAGSFIDNANAVALDAAGSVYLAGQSASSDLPVTSGAFQTKNNGAARYLFNAFVAKINIPSLLMATRTNLTPNPNPSTVGSSVTFTATVSAASGTPAGTVAFTVDGSIASDETLDSSGQATYSTTSLSTGTHTVAAAYAGSSTFAASASSPLTETVNPLTSPAMSWTPSPSSITYPTALVAGQLNAQAMNGSTNVSNDGAFVYYLNSVGGTEASVGTVLPGGSQQLCVQWTPVSAYASQFAPASACASITVNAAATVISWNPASPIISGTALGAGQFNASVAAGSTNVTSLGTLQYYVGPVAGGVVATSSTILPFGSSQLCAQWTPSASYQLDYASSSFCATVNVITQLATVTRLTPNENPVFLSNAVTLTATVTASAGTPTGTVTFLNDSTALGSARLNPSGTATLDITTLPTGSANIVASYAGDNSNQPSTSAALVEVVEDFAIAPASPSTAAVEPGKQATFTFTLSPVAPAMTIPATITFSSNCLPSGATCTVSPASVAAGQGTTSVTFTIAVPLTSIAQVTGKPMAPSDRQHISGSMPFALALLVLPFAPGLRRWCRRLHSMFPVLLLMLASLGAAVVLGGCGGPATGYFGQAPATSTITVTGSSGSLSHSASMTLTVE